MIPPVFGFAIGLAGLSFVGFGAALALRGRALLAAALSVLGGLAAIAGALVGAGGQHQVGWWLVSLAGLGAVPLALVVYPRIAWHNPLDAIAFTVVLVGGTLSLVTLDHPDVVVFAWLAQVLAVAMRTWWRIDREVPALRQPLLWVASVLALLAVAFGLAAFSSFPDILLAVVLGLLGLVPAAMYFGVTRAEAVDVRDLVVRFVVGVVTLFGYVACVMVILALGGALGVTPSGGWLALICGLVAIGFHPAQVALLGVIDELVYGPRRDPLLAAAALVDRAGDDPLQALLAIREALGLPYASLVVQGESAAATGEAPERTRSIPLSPDSGEGGRLVVGVRSGDLDLTARDRLVLGLVAPLLAQNIRATRLAADLQSSREHTITLIEEERRRLRRDLHDGLGPRLTGVAYTIDAARNALSAGAAAETDGLLVGLRAETAAAIDEIRRIVYAMRPPAIDEVGLVQALRQQTGSVRRPDGRPFHVEVQAPPLPALPAATEVAAYRIVVEAVTNAARHSGGSRALVRLTVEHGELVATIADDGDPGPVPWAPGVGLASMRERAGELGGRLVVDRGADGTRVRAELPIGPNGAGRP